MLQEVLGHASERTNITFHSDNHGCYTSAYFKEQLQKRGMKQSLTPPQTPSRNETVERMNKTLFNGVRVMMHSSGLPDSLWGYACLHFIKIRNIIPNSNLPDSCPFTTIHGVKPSIKHYMIFGCLGYVATPVKTAKLEPKAKVGFYLGIDQASYSCRMYLLDDKRGVVTSRDVKFYQETTYKTYIANSAMEEDTAKIEETTQEL
eukprot:Awhi_evm1s15745